jgi:hypothetical protein
MWYNIKWIRPSSQSLMSIIEAYYNNTVFGCLTDQPTHLIDVAYVLRYKKCQLYSSIGTAKLFPSHIHHFWFGLRLWPWLIRHRQSATLTITQWMSDRLYVIFQSYIEGIPFLNFNLSACIWISVLEVSRLYTIQTVPNTITFECERWGWRWGRCSNIVLIV